MKKILGISLCALFAVSAANAEIASTEYVNQQIDGMDAAATSGQYVTVVSQANGQVSATGANFADAVTADGTNAPKSSAVAAYVTSNAVNTVTSGETDGTIKVDDTEVAVAGLGSAAFADAETFAAATDLGDLASKNKVATGDFESGAIMNADINDNAAIGTNKIAFTDPQKLALNSGITTGLVTQIGTNETKIDNLDRDIQGMNQTQTTGQYVKYVKQESGQVTAEGESFDTSVSDTSNNAPTSKAVASHVATYVTSNAVNTVTSGGTRGTISVDNQDVAVTGLGTAAYEAKETFAAAASLGDLASKDKVATGDFESGAIMNADINDNAAIGTNKIAFTDPQKLALNSGIDSTKVEQINANKTAIDDMVKNADGYDDCKVSTYGCTLVVDVNGFKWEAVKRNANGQ